MAKIIVGESVVNRFGEKGTIVSLDKNFICVDFKTRIAKLQFDAFEQKFLKYENSDLQREIDESILEEENEKERTEEKKRIAKEKASAERRKLQAEMSRTHFKVAVSSVSTRLEPALLNLNLVRKNDANLIQKIFNVCDEETKALYASVTPRMEYLKYASDSKSKFCVGFLSKHFDTYVFRVFSRNDIYSKDAMGVVEVKRSDVTEVLRVLRVNDKLYYFSKNLTAGSENLVNTTNHNSWHVSVLTSALMLNEIIRNCECEFLNDYISAKNVDCLHYVKLLFAALCNNKAEIVFKNRLYSSSYRINNFISYLEEFSSKQIDFASKNNVLNTLPVIKRYGLYDIEILEDMERIMSKRRYGNSIYNTLSQILTRLNFDCSDIDKRLIGFLKKTDRFDPALYLDYITELEYYPGITVRDFFDKDYVTRHQIMISEKNIRHDEEENRRYAQVAKELSWIDREENDYHIIVPKTIQDFKYEGELQHNCVYTCRYYNYVIKRQSIVVFLRKDKDIPFVTIEYDYETFEVLQAYGKFNQRIGSGVFEYIVGLGKNLNYERSYLA